MAFRQRHVKLSTKDGSSLSPISESLIRPKPRKQASQLTKLGGNIKTKWPRVTVTGLCKHKAPDLLRSQIKSVQLYAYANGLHVWLVGRVAGHQLSMRQWQQLQSR